MIRPPALSVKLKYRTIVIFIIEWRRFMENYCPKYGETRKELTRGCVHSRDYCRYRSSCLSHFRSEERRKRGGDDTPERSDPGSSG
jgi:hypothetical protein